MAERNKTMKNYHPLMILLYCTFSAESENGIILTIFVINVRKEIKKR